MKPVDDLSRSLVAFDQDSAVVAVIELSNASWLVAGTLPPVARRPLKSWTPTLLRLRIFSRDGRSRLRPPAGRSAG